MIEPGFCLRELHVVTSNSFENVGGRAPRARGIREFLAQTATDHV